MKAKSITIELLSRIIAITGVIVVAAIGITKSPLKEDFVFLFYQSSGHPSLIIRAPPLPSD